MYVTKFQPEAQETARQLAETRQAAELFELLGNLAVLLGVVTCICMVSTVASVHKEKGAIGKGCTCISLTTGLLGIIVALVLVMIGLLFNTLFTDPQTE